MHKHLKQPLIPADHINTALSAGIGEIIDVAMAKNRDERYNQTEDLLEDLTRRESIEQVRQAVLSLPPVFREAVVLCDLQDSSYEDAAVALDCPVGTVRSRLSRGRAMLVRKLRGAACTGRSIECSQKSI